MMAAHFTTYPTRWEGRMPKPKAKRKPRRKPLFQCMECGRKFYSLTAAENAAYGDGCPGCGSTDVDEC